MKLYLHNQTRNRDIDEYIQKLCISQSEFDRLNSSQYHVLLVGGGFSPIQPKFSQTLFHVTNIDFSPSKQRTTKLHQITGDFLTQNLKKNSFNEVWALYSLPLYAQQVSSIDIFMAKAILALRPKGKLRIFPLEFNDDKKLITRDAEWEISTRVVTNTTMNFLSQLKQWGVSVKIIPLNANNEKTVIIKVPNNFFKKYLLNKKMLEIARKQTEKLSKLPKIQLEGEKRFES